METSAPASFHACPLAASRKTTRTFFFCVSSVSATTLPVFPEAPSTINIGGPPGFARLQSQREGATFAIVCQMDVVHAIHGRRASWYARPEPARGARPAADRTEHDASCRADWFSQAWSPVVIARSTEN